MPDENLSWFYWACWNERDKITGEFPEQGRSCSHRSKDCEYPHGNVSAGRITCNHTIGGPDSCDDCDVDICGYDCEAANVFGCESSFCVTCNMRVCRECKTTDHADHKMSVT
jgi:hypothetical protein